jgi:hypothetical protein
LEYLSMASRICELDAVPHALLESCQRPFQIRGTVNGPISKVSKLVDEEGIFGGTRGRFGGEEEEEEETKDLT